MPFKLRTSFTALAFALFKMPFKSFIQAPHIIAAQFPTNNHLWGVITRRLLARSLGIYGLLFLSGFSIALFTDSAQWYAFGLGLMLPGGGFLAYADITHWHGVIHLALAAMAISLFIGALVIWFATGNVLVPPLVWLLAALAAASMRHGGAQASAIIWVPLSIFSAALILSLSAYFLRLRALKQRLKNNRYLVESHHDEVQGLKHTDQQPMAEFTPNDLALMRFVLDRALQPLAQYEGFEWLDQYQTAAVRYQLNFMGYALSMAQATRLPALSAYLNVAQQRLIDKQTDHRIWRYWALENFWGNLKYDPDPVAHENIMYTGFCATQIAMYQAASGLRDYDQAGSFTLHQTPEKAYAYDFPSLISALNREYQRSPFYLIACEPNWVYPLCNTIGAAAIKAYDAQNGSQLWPNHEHPFRHHFETEFVDPWGQIVPCRSTYTGLALPTIGGVMPQAMPCFFLNSVMPDIALRQWLLLRRGLLIQLNGTTSLRRDKFWPIDTGNYRFSRAAAYAGTALAATEIGDQEVAALCLSALEAECPTLVADGLLYRPAASVWAHAVELLARSGTQNGFRNLIEKPNDSKVQPMISHATYPDVLFAYAAYHQGTLKAVLYPGGPKAQQQLELSGLVPWARYHCEGTQESHLIADDQGRGRIHVALHARTEIRVCRAG